MCSSRVLNDWGRRLEAAQHAAEHALVPAEVGGHALSRESVEAVVPVKGRGSTRNPQHMDGMRVKDDTKRTLRHNLLK